MSVVLGPAGADSVNRGSSTNSDSLRQSMRLLAARDPGKWKAGHLLNADFGGSGADTKNLAPLTGTANRQHSTIENRIKGVLIAAGSWARRNPGDPFWYGVRYVVTVNAINFGDFSPYTRAPSDIIVQAEFVKQDKVSGAITCVPSGSEPFDLGAFSSVNITIHNTDADLL